MKKICVVTSTRAEYGLLKGLISCIHQDPDLELCLVVTGTHLLKEFGNTVAQIEEDGFPIAERIDIMMGGDTPEAISKTQGIALISFADMYARQKPDMLVVLGDRTEILPIAMAPANDRIPIAHISGGEITEGAIDDCIRHCLTKVSYLHFPGCEEYRRRIIQLGEQPERVFNYGDVGVEMVRNAHKLSREQLTDRLGFDFRKPYLCVVFHPVTLEIESAEAQVRNLISAVDSCKEYNYVFIQGNSDAGGQVVAERIKEYCEKAQNCCLFKSLRPEVYISVLANAEALMGNSSSGIVEAPALGVPTINIGDRQKGRLQANSIINCEPEAEEIITAVKELKSNSFAAQMKCIRHPYGDGQVSKMICKCIKEQLSKGVDLKKRFYDIEIGVQK